MLKLIRKLHLCLTIAVAANTLAVIIEGTLPKTDIRPVLARACLTMWQGTWFLHIGVVIWPLPWPIGDLLVWKDHNSHPSIMFTNTIFVGHLLSIMAFTLFIGRFIQARIAKMAKTGKIEGVKETYGNVELDLSSEDDAFLAD